MHLAKLQSHADHTSDDIKPDAEPGFPSATSGRAEPDPRLGHKQLFVLLK